MTYVGATPTTGDFKKLDSITTSSATTFNLRQGGVAVYPQSANLCIVSLNGVIQAPVDAFTIVNDTIVFASSLASSDVINFILVLGNVNDIGVPSSSTVGVSQLSASGSASSSTYLRGDNTWAAAGGDLSFGGDTFGANKVIGANDAYSLSLETSGNTALTIDANGIITKPLTPCVMVRNGTAQTNIAVDTATKIEFDTERFDQNADFNTSTNVFTAPVTGRYLISCVIVLDQLDSAATFYRVEFTTSNYYYKHFIIDPDYFDADQNYWTQGATIIADMDASDTLQMDFYQSGGTQQTDITNMCLLSIGLFA